VTIVDAEELAGAMTEKLAELFEETHRPQPQRRTPRKTGMAGMAAQAGR
jgi:cobaltochelatase CobT